MSGGKLRLRVTLLISFITLLGALLELVKNLVIAYRYGVGTQTDVFFAALSIPNAYSAFWVSACLTGLVPLFAAWNQESASRAWGISGNIVLFSALITLVFSVVACMFAAPIVDLLVPGFPSVEKTITVALFRRFASLFLIMGCVGVLSAVLNSRHDFLLSSANKLVANGLLLFGLLVTRIYSITWLADLVIIGAVTHALLLAFRIGAGGLRITFRWTLEPWRTRLLLAAIFGPFAAIIVRQPSFLAERMIGSYLASGSISALTYGYQLVVGAATIISTGMVTPLLPLLAQQKLSCDKLMFLKQGFHYLVGVTLPFSVGFYLLAGPAVRVLFHGNAARVSAGAETVLVVKMYALGITFNVLAQHFQSLHWAERRYRTLIIHNAFVAAVNILLDLILAPEMGVVGLALGFSLAGLASMCRMYWLVSRGYGSPFSSFREAQVLRPAIATVCMGVLVYLGRPWIDAAGGPLLSTLIGKGIKMGAVVATGMLVYFAAAAVMRVNPYFEMLQKFRRAPLVKRPAPVPPPPQVAV